jgi:hypothetical protein
LVSGKAYSVTPVVYVSRTVSKTIITQSPYTCDPIPATSINKGKFNFACKTLRGKDVGHGIQTISWLLPKAASVSIQPHIFSALRPTSTAKYVVDAARATTTLIPMTHEYGSSTSSITMNMAPTKTVKVTTTSTCSLTVTVTVTATPVSGSRRRRAGGANLPPDLELLPGSGFAATDADAGHDPAHDDNGNDNSTDTGMDLKERAAVTRAAVLGGWRVIQGAGDRLMQGTPTIGKPDFIYPPYGVTTIYVKSISTTTYWDYSITRFYTTGPTVTTTILYASIATGTVTVTVTRA